MKAVTAERITQFGTSGILDGLTAGNKKKPLLKSGRKRQRRYKPCAGLDAVPHLLLIGVIIRESFVV